MILKFLKWAIYPLSLGFGIGIVIVVVNAIFN